MKRIYFIGLISFGLNLFVNSQNLITNGSFESNNTSLGANWFDFCNNEITYLQINNLSSCHVDFSTSVPVVGSPNSFSIHSLVGPPGDWGLRTFIEAPNGTYVYRLNYWMKSLPDVTSFPSYGVVRIGTYSMNQYNVSKYLSASNTAWTQYTITDTLNTSIGDTIFVELYSPGPDFFQAQNEFDLVELTIIDTLSSIGFQEIFMNQIKVFPIPANERLEIEVSKVGESDLLVNVYDLVGRCVKTIRTKEEKITVEKEDLNSGIYFLKVIESETQKVLATSKIVFN